MSKPVLKCILVGESTVGKTQLLLRYTEERYSPGISTVGIDFKNKDIVINGTEYRLQLWDTAGQERFRNIAISYYRKADGICLVYDVAKTSSYEALQGWLDSIRQATDGTVPIILVGNKSDLEFRVPVEDAEQLASESDLPLFFTSALSGSGVREAFEAVAKAIIMAKGSRINEETTDITKPSKNDGKKKGCCK